MELIAAAAVVVLRRTPELQVLMVRRSEQQRAFPGNWTFPGGTLDPEDGPADDPQALRQCALRELFEETGLLPGYSGASAPLALAQQELLNQTLDWATFCARLAYRPPLAELQFLGLRVTPPIMPRRFETAYFLLEDVGGEPLAFSPEMAEGGWFHPRELLGRWREQQAQIPAPVLEVLKLLDSRGVDLPGLQAQANSRETIPLPIELYPGIELVPLRTPTLEPATHTNGYFVGGQSFVIIDPASPYPDQQERLRAAVQRRLAAGDRPVEVVLTHHHRDHVGAACFLRDWLGMPIAAHARTAELLAFDVDRQIDDGEVWELGVDAAHRPWRLEALFTPGHAPGHLCFIDRRADVAIVGDMLAGMGTILIKRPRGNMGQYLASLDRLAQAGVRHGLPAHGPVIGDLPARCREYIAHRQMRNQRILSALAAGSLSLEELLPVVYSDVDPRALGLARWSLDAHLGHLEEIQAVHQRAERWALG